MSTLAELFGLDSNASTDDLQQAAVMLPDIRDYHAVPVSVTPRLPGTGCGEMTATARFAKKPSRNTSTT